jgi:hypothetical protein
MNIDRYSESIDQAGRKLPEAAAGRYVGAVVGGAVLAIAALCALYGTMYQTGHLPPPPLSNNVCVDEKLVFMRDQPLSDPNFLVIGSSVAWRNFDSSVVVREIPGARPLNGGFCGVHIHQSEFIAAWLIDRFPLIKDVVLIASPLDYSECKGSGQVFDPADANKLAFERNWKGGFYLRYFDPVSLVRNMMRQARDRARDRAIGLTTKFTDYGDGPIDTITNRGLFYGPMSKLDPACFAALHSLAEKLAKEQRRFLLVTVPLHPEWKLRYDPNLAFMQRLAQGIATALEGTGAEVWDANGASMIDAAAFTDAVHIRWSAADTFTEEIVQKLHRK